MTEANDPNQTDKLGKYLLSSDAARTTHEVDMALQQVPLTLQPFFKQESDLNRELIQRFPNMPLMSTSRFRDVYKNGERGVATLSSQDGSSSLIVDVSSKTYEIQFAFTYGSMLSLRFHLTELSALDRQTWLENVKNRENDVVFLWGQSRWANDYIICVPHKYYISLLAFSPNNFEAAVRITPAASGDLFEWLQTFWHTKGVETEDEDEDKPDTPDTNTPSILSSW